MRKFITYKIAVIYTDITVKKELLLVKIHNQSWERGGSVELQ